MSHARQLPLYQAAMDLAVHLEGAVRRFSRYHKYTLGSGLRRVSQRLCRLVTQAAQCGAARRERLAPLYERVFIHDAHANRVGHGTHAAVNRLQAFMRSATHGGTRPAPAARCGCPPAWRAWAGNGAGWRAPCRATCRWCRWAAAGCCVARPMPCPPACAARCARKAWPTP